MCLRVRGILCLLCAVLLDMGIGRVEAQTVGRQSFFRVYDAKELASDSLFVIGAVLPTDEALYVLNSVVQNGKCQAVKVGAAVDFEEKLIDVSPSVLWKIIKQKDGTFVLQSAENKQYLYAGKSTQTGLELNSTKKTSWVLSGEDGLFRFQNNDAPSRYIGLWSNLEQYCFGNYSNCDSRSLVIYKCGALEKPMVNVTWPEDGARVVLGNAKVVLGRNNEVLSAADYLLQNGGMAVDNHTAVWHCVRQPDSCFCMKTATGFYLGEDFKVQEEPALWKIVNSGLELSCEPNKIAAVCNGRFVMKNRNEVQSEDYVKLQPAAESCAQELNEGILALRGGWRADSLAAINWTSVRELDLSAAQLPFYLKPFEKRPKEQNTIIYVSEAQQKLVPASWPFVVKVSEEENELITSTEVHDKNPFYCSRPFRVKNGMLTYKRKTFADGNWETLFLPFAAQLPDDYEAARFVSVTDENLLFERINQVDAYVPLIVRNKKDAFGKDTLELVALDGMVDVSLKTTSSASFSGTLDTLFVERLSNGIYLLNSIGETFRLAGEGSFLYPFRSYLQLSATEADYKFQMVGDDVTFINQVEKLFEEDKSYYGMDGKQYRYGKRKSVSPGVYVVGRKKRFVK
mgnify:CR=1 FL=1